jgi:hypothetical protein
MVPLRSSSIYFSKIDRILRRWWKCMKRRRFRLKMWNAKFSIWWNRLIRSNLRWLTSFDGKILLGSSVEWAMTAVVTSNLCMFMGLRYTCAMNLQWLWTHCVCSFNGLSRILGAWESWSLYAGYEKLW